MTITMAISTTSTSSLLLHSSSSASISGKPYSFPTYPISIPKNAIFPHARVIPQLGFTPFNQWNSFKGSGISISRFSARTKKKRRSRLTRVYASLFGVGAPEALVIGVVALLVFGPKGLAEVARNLGKTLRAFQPTIRELQEVSRDFKSTLEREIGLDDIDNPVPKSSTSSAAKPTPESSETISELDGSPPVNEEPKPDPYLKVSGPQLLGALAQLQKEQAEEKEREEKEKEEREKAQVQLETTKPSPPDTETLDTPQDAASSMMTPSQHPESNLLQEATSVPGPKNDTEI